MAIKPGLKSIDELLFEKGTKKMAQIASIQQILIDASITKRRAVDVRITTEMLAFARKNRKVEKTKIDEIIPNQPEAEE